MLLILSAGFCAPDYTEAQVRGTEIFRQEGIASWYGPEFDGRPTASGEIFNSSFLTAAHPTLPFGTMLLITNRHNNKQVTVRVNDRGPFVSARIIDVSRAAAEQLDMLATGTAPVLVESVERIVMPSTGSTGAADPYWSLPPSQPAAPQPVPAQPPAPAPIPVVPAPPVNPAPVQPSYPPAPVITEAPAPVAPPIAPPPPAPPPVRVPAYSQAALTPVINPAPNKVYRLQIGSYKVPRHAVEVFDKLKNAGLNPAYERNGEFFRVVLAGIRGSDVQSIAERLGSAGFREALIREER